MSGGGWGLVRSEIWRPFHKMKNFWKLPFLGALAEFPYLGIISLYQVFLHNEPISAWECNIYIIYESWVRKSSCDSRYARKLDFSYYAQIWKFSPRLPKMEFFKKIHFFEKVSRFCFQRVLNHLQTLSLSQVMQENIISKKLSLRLNPEWRSYQSST